MNSRDSFPIWKFKNRAPKSCSAGPILWPPIISFELDAEIAEEIDLEKCTFRNFGSSVTLTLILDRVEVTLVRICGRGLPTHQIRWKSEKLFVDVRTYLSSNLLGHRRGDDSKIGGRMCPFLRGAGLQSNTMSPGSRPTSIPSGILLHPAVWPQRTRAENGVLRGSWVPI